MRSKTKTYTITDIRINKKIKSNFSVITGVKNIGNYTNSEIGPFLGRIMYLELAI